MPWILKRTYLAISISHTDIWFLFFFFNVSLYTVYIYSVNILYVSAWGKTILDVNTSLKLIFLFIQNDFWKEFSKERSSWLNVFNFKARTFAHML